MSGVLRGAVCANHAILRHGTVQFRSPLSGQGAQQKRGAFLFLVTRHNVCQAARPSILFIALLAVPVAYATPNHCSLRSQGTDARAALLVVTLTTGRCRGGI